MSGDIKIIMAINHYIISAFSKRTCYYDLVITVPSGSSTPAASITLRTSTGWANMALTGNIEERRSVKNAGNSTCSTFIISMITNSSTDNIDMRVRCIILSPSLNTHITGNSATACNTIIDVDHICS